MQWLINDISVSQEGALSQEQIEARNDEENLEETKQKLNQLKDDIIEDKKEDAELDGVEGGIQRLITVMKHHKLFPRNNIDLDRQPEKF